MSIRFSMYELWSGAGKRYNSAHNTFPASILSQIVKPNESSLVESHGAPPQFSLSSILIPPIFNESHSHNGMVYVRPTEWNFQNAFLVISPFREQLLNVSLCPWEDSQVLVCFTRPDSKTRFCLPTQLRFPRVPFAPAKLLEYNCSPSKLC